jgi:uncharacterized protein with GYD domain
MYMITANYTAQGIEGIRAKGAKSRVDAVRARLDGVGGSLESFYFAFGDTDVFAVADVPGDEAAAAVAMTINATGAVSVRTTKLLTVEQVDYAPPGA